MQEFPANAITILVAERLFSNDPGEIDRLQQWLGHDLPIRFPDANRGPAGVVESRSAIDEELLNCIPEVESLIGRATGWI
jgi:hypothetical protein